MSLTKPSITRVIMGSASLKVLLVFLSAFSEVATVTLLAMSLCQPLKTIKHPAQVSDNYFFPAALKAIRRCFT